MVPPIQASWRRATSAHLRLVAKKRDASTDPLRRLHAHMVQHNVDFVGCDFNMSACSTVGDVLTDSEFAAPGTSLHYAQAPV